MHILKLLTFFTTFVYKPNKIWVYKGREFYNKLMKLWLHDNDIKMYPTHNEGKSVVLKDLLQPHFLHIYTHI